MSDQLHFIKQTHTLQLITENKGEKDKLQLSQNHIQCNTMQSYTMQRLM